MAEPGSKRATAGLRSGSSRWKFAQRKPSDRSRPREFVSTCFAGASAWLSAQFGEFRIKTGQPTFDSTGSLVATKEASPPTNLFVFGCSFCVSTST